MLIQLRYAVRLFLLLIVSTLWAEGAIPDAIAKRILAETIKPYFKNNDYAQVALMLALIN